MRKYILTLFAVLLIVVPCFAGDGDPVREGKEVTYGINIGSGAYLDDANVTDGNIPYMQAAGAGFGDSPLSTDGTDITNSGDLTVSGGDLTLGTSSVSGNATYHDAGTAVFKDDGDDTQVVIGPVVDGTTMLGIAGSLFMSLSNPPQTGMIYMEGGGGYGPSLVMNNAGTQGALFFMVPTNNVYGTGGNKFIMGHGVVSSANTDVMIDSDGNMAIGTIDMDGTPAIGRTIIKGSTNDGSTNILVGRDSDEANVFTMDTNGSIALSGGITNHVTTVNAATYDLLTTDYILHITYTGTGAVTSLTLPTAQCTAGRTIIVKDAGGNAETNSITIDTEGAETIDGAATFVIDANYEAISLYSDGSNWFVF